MSGFGELRLEIAGSPEIAAKDEEAAAPAGRPPPLDQLARC
jgi:hypothetical protein